MGQRWIYMKASVKLDTSEVDIRASLALLKTLDFNKYSSLNVAPLSASCSFFLDKIAQFSPMFTKFARRNSREGAGGGGVST